MKLANIIQNTLASFLTIMIGILLFGCNIYHILVQNYNVIIINIFLILIYSITLGLSLYYLTTSKHKYKDKVVCLNKLLILINISLPITIFLKNIIMLTLIITLYIITLTKTYKISKKSFILLIICIIYINTYYFI